MCKSSLVNSPVPSVCQGGLSPLLTEIALKPDSNATFPFKLPPPPQQQPPAPSPGLSQAPLWVHLVNDWEDLAQQNHPRALSLKFFVTLGKLLFSRVRFSVSICKGGVIMQECDSLSGTFGLYFESHFIFIFSERYFSGNPDYVTSQQDLGQHLETKHIHTPAAKYLNTHTKRGKESINGKQHFRPIFYLNEALGQILSKSP